MLQVLREKQQYQTIHRTLLQFQLQRHIFHFSVESQLLGNADPRLVSQNPNNAS
jgi:hypothetical protein